MKRHFYILMLIWLAFFKPESTIAQNKNILPKKNCKNTVLEFYTLAKAKDYIKAYPLWVKSFTNCPTSSKMIYKYGLKIIEDRYQNTTEDQKENESTLIDSIFKQRIYYFPENLGKVYSDWATSLEKRAASKEEIFEKLKLAFSTDPAQMSIKNIAKYFQEVTNKHKNTNPKKVFDTYDDALDAVNKKIAYHIRAYDVLNAKKNDSVTLSVNEKIQIKNHSINLRGLGQVENLLDAILNEGTIMSCKRLISFYEKGFDAHKTDVKWLKRATFRLNRNGCTDSKLYKKMIQAYLEVDSSPNGCVLYLGTNNDLPIETIRSMKEAIKTEKDPYQRAEYYYRIAINLKRKSKTQSRQYAYKALEERPSLGKAYLLIATLYASSANACGTDEFSKRIVFVAAADKAKKAKEVDPSITSRANKYIKSYLTNSPRRGGFPTGIVNKDAEFEIKCWIGETVKIP